MDTPRMKTRSASRLEGTPVSKIVTVEVKTSTGKRGRPSRSEVKKKLTYTIKTDQMSTSPIVLVLGGDQNQISTLPEILQPTPAPSASKQGVYQMIYSDDDDSEDTGDDRASNSPDETLQSLHEKLAQLQDLIANYDPKKHRRRKRSCKRLRLESEKSDLNEVATSDSGLGVEQNHPLLDDEDDSLPLAQMMLKSKASQVTSQASEHSLNDRILKQIDEEIGNDGGTCDSHSDEARLIRAQMEENWRNVVDEYSHEDLVLDEVHQLQEEISGNLPCLEQNVVFHEVNQLHEEISGNLPSSEQNAVLHEVNQLQEGIRTIWHQLLNSSKDNRPATLDSSCLEVALSSSIDCDVVKPCSVVCERIDGLLDKGSRISARENEFVSCESDLMSDFPNELPNNLKSNDNQIDVVFSESDVFQLSDGPSLQLPDVPNADKELESHEIPNDVVVHSLGAEFSNAEEFPDLNESQTEILDEGQQSEHSSSIDQNSATVLPISTENITIGWEDIPRDSCSSDDGEDFSYIDARKHVVKVPSVEENSEASSLSDDDDDVIANVPAGQQTRLSDIQCVDSSSSDDEYVGGVTVSSKVPVCLATNSEDADLSHNFEKCLPTDLEPEIPSSHEKQSPISTQTKDEDSSRSKDQESVPFNLSTMKIKNLPTQDQQVSSSSSDCEDVSPSNTSTVENGKIPSRCDMTINEDEPNLTSRTEQVIPVQRECDILEKDNPLPDLPPSPMDSSSSDDEIAESCQTSPTRSFLPTQILTPDDSSNETVRKSPFMVDELNAEAVYSSSSDNEQENTNVNCSNPLNTPDNENDLIESCSDDNTDEQLLPKTEDMDTEELVFDLKSEISFDKYEFMKNECNSRSVTPTKTFTEPDEKLPKTENVDSVSPARHSSPKSKIENNPHVLSTSRRISTILSRKICYSDSSDDDEMISVLPECETVSVEWPRVADVSDSSEEDKFIIDDDVSSQESVTEPIVEEEKNVSPVKSTRRRTRTRNVSPGAAEPETEPSSQETEDVGKNVSPVKSVRRRTRNTLPDADELRINSTAKGENIGSPATRRRTRTRNTSSVSDERESEIADTKNKSPLKNQKKQVRRRIIEENVDDGTDNEPEVDSQEEEKIYEMGQKSEDSQTSAESDDVVHSAESEKSPKNVKKRKSGLGYDDDGDEIEAAEPHTEENDVKIEHEDIRSPSVTKTDDGHADTELVVLKSPQKSGKKKRISGEIKMESETPKKEKENEQDEIQTVVLKSPKMSGRKKSGWVINEEPESETHPSEIKNEHDGLKIQNDATISPKKLSKKTTGQFEIQDLLSSGVEKNKDDHGDEITAKKLKIKKSDSKAKQSKKRKFDENDVEPSTEEIIPFHSNDDDVVRLPDHFLKDLAAVKKPKPRPKLKTVKKIHVEKTKDEFTLANHGSTAFAAKIAVNSAGREQFAANLKHELLYGSRVRRVPSQTLKVVSMKQRF